MTVSAITVFDELSAFLVFVLKLHLIEQLSVMWEHACISAVTIVIPEVTLAWTICLLLSSESFDVMAIVAVPSEPALAFQEVSADRESNVLSLSSLNVLLRCDSACWLLFLNLLSLLLHLLGNGLPHRFRSLFKANVCVCVVKLHFSVQMIVKFGLLYLFWQMKSK